MANVKLTWKDNADNDTKYYVYRNSGTQDPPSSNSPTAVWEDETVPTGINTNLAGESISPLMKTFISDPVPNSKDEMSWVDVDVPVGSWSYVVAAYNEAGRTFCEGPPVQHITITA